MKGEKMKKYLMPQVSKVRLTTKEQVLAFCHSADSPIYQCWKLPEHFPLMEIYGPIDQLCLKCHPQ